MYIIIILFNREVIVLLERLEILEDRYEELNQLLSDPKVIQDVDKLREYSKEQSDMEDIVTKYRKYKEVVSELDAAKEMLQEDLEDEMAEMVKLEIQELTQREEQIR